MARVLVGVKRVIDYAVKVKFLFYVKLNLNLNNSNIIRVFIVELYINTRIFIYIFILDSC